MEGEKKPEDLKQNNSINANVEATTRKPSIRTMKGDTDELFKNTRPTLMQMIGPVDRATSRRIYKEDSHKKTIIIGIITIFILGGGVFWFIKSRQTAVVVPAVKTTPPAPFFTTETARTITVNAQDRQQFLKLMQDSFDEKERYGTIKRVIIKIQDQTGERYATIADLLGYYHIIPPEGLLSYLDAPLMTFMFYGESGTRFGFMTKTHDADRTILSFLSWEPSLILDFQPFFFGEKPGQILSSFEDRTYRNIDWRFLKLSRDKDFGIGYLIFPARNVLVVTTGKEETETLINRLFEAR